jgi:putative tricarboxylic transport membrane protein
VRTAAILMVLGVIVASCAAATETGRPPERVEVVVHSEPGGGIDLDVREWIRQLESERLITAGSWTVSNRSGGAGARAMAHLAEQRGRADVIAGMTLTWLVTPLTTAEAKVTYRDLTPIATLVHEPTVAAVAASSPYRTLPEFIAAARATPGKLTQVGGQVSSAHNVYREIIQRTTGARWNFVPLATRGERLAALLGGHVDITFTEPGELQEHVRAGTVRILASVGAERVSIYPSAPTLAELGIAVELPRQFRGIVGPPKMPAWAVTYYRDLFERLSATKTWSDFLDRNALRNGYSVGDELARTLDGENEALQGVFRELGIGVR